jgi:hypothetical protein
VHAYYHPFHGPRGARALPLSQFLAGMTHVVAREPAVFLQAAAKACQIEAGPGGADTYVALRAARPTAREARAARDVSRFLAGSDSEPLEAAEGAARPAPPRPAGPSRRALTH